MGLRGGPPLAGEASAASSTPHFLAQHKLGTSSSAGGGAPTTLTGLLAHGRELLDAAEASNGRKDLLDISGDATPPEYSSPGEEDGDYSGSASEERGARPASRREGQRPPGGVFPLPGVASLSLVVATTGPIPHSDSGAEKGTAGASAAGRSLRGVQYLPGGAWRRAVEAAPYSRHNDEPRPPALHSTSDLAAVRRVLARGAATTVRHTLKSQLAEDEVMVEGVSILLPQ